MNARDLDPNELVALTGLVAHLIAADGKISPGEAAEIDEIADELGLSDSFRAEIADAMGLYPTLDVMLERAERVNNPDAQELIRTILIDLANSDELRDRAEDVVLERLAEVWKRS